MPEKKKYERPTMYEMKAVRHGKWLFVDGCYVEDTICCSECGEEYCYEADSWRSYHYCPNCGAKMTAKKAAHP